MGPHGDGTVLLELLADTQTFGVDGLRLFADLQFRAGDAQADLVIVPAAGG